VVRFRVLPDRSKVWIHARSSLHPIDSSTDGLEGTLDLELQGGGRVNLSVAPSAHLEFPVENLSSGNRLEDRELKRRIDSRRYPTIEGDLTAMKDTDTDGQYLVRGDLTFKGVTRSYEDEMTLAVQDDKTIRLEGESTFDIRDFGMEPPRILILKVEPEVRVRVVIVAEQEGV
jgi:polyisoprenoid-binding protein YceI